ncbi:unnamed protein product [Urochloa humidicola]
MPPLPASASASATATRFAAHWVIDVLAGDETLEFSVLKALVGASSESLAGAPEATRERVALRCLEEVSAVIAAGGDAAATAKVLRADGARSCEDLLLQLIGEVGSSGNLEKDLLPPFSQEIQNIIRIKKPALPETSFELLREVDPKITSMALPSQLEQNGTTQLDNDQFLSSSHDHVNIEKTRLPTENGDLQQEAQVNFVDESDTRSMENDSVAPTSVLQQPCTFDSKRCNPPQEDAIVAASLGARSPEMSPIVEGDISVGTVPASASCDAALLRSITEPLSKHVMEDHNATDQPQSHRKICPSQHHYIDGERPQNGSTNNLSSKDPRHEELSMHTTVNPDIDRSGDALPFVSAQNTTNISQPHSSEAQMNALQHKSGEKVNQDLDDVSAIIQLMEKDHVREELSLQAASVLPSISCNGAIQGGKSETNHLPGNSTEHATVFGQQNVDKSHVEVSGDDKVNQALHDGSIQENNAVSGGMNAQASPMSQACNIYLHDKISEANYLSEENTRKNRTDVQKCGYSASIPGSAHVHEELSLKAASVLPSISCNGAIQGGKSETNHLSGNAAEHATVFGQQNVHKSHVEVSDVDKVNQDLHDGSIQENNAVNGGTNAQASPMSQACNIYFHDKISEANYLSEENTRKNRTDVQKCGYSASIPGFAQDGDGKSTMKVSNKENFGDTSVEISVPSSDVSLRGTVAGLLAMTDKMPFCTKDQDINDSLGDLSQQYLCIKCGKDGQLLKCSSCVLTAHDSCFGSSATFEETGLFYCPVCFCTKATEAYQKAKQTYCEARKNLAAFIGKTRLVKQHDEQPSGVMPEATNREGHSNGCDLSKRKNIHQNGAGNLAHRDEEPHRQSKKQKINTTGNGCAEHVITEKVPCPNSGVAPMNEHTILKNSSSSKRVQGTEKQQQVESKEAVNDNSSHETRKNQEVEADREDGLANSHQPDDSDELEATSSNDSGNRSSPPWRDMRHKKARLHEKETMASSNSRKTVQQDQHMPSSSKQRNYAYPQKRYSNPIAPSGRRTKLCWTAEEEAALKEAMEKFTPQDDKPIPWIQILEYGRDVFHRTRLPCDLRVKWRNMKKRAGC